MHEQGYQATGVEQVITRAGGSKGSFYHHFKSKEDLGCAVLDTGAEAFISSIEERLWDTSLPPIDRVLRMVELVTLVQEANDFRRGCLFGNLAGELGGSSNRMREHLATIFARWTRAIARTLRDAQGNGDLPADRDPDALAHFILLSVEGAILFAKTERSTKPLEDCRHFLAILLGRPPTPAPLREPIV